MAATKRKIEDAPSPRRKKIFVGRKKEIKIFQDALTEKFGTTVVGDESGDSKVLVFHGVSGIGKTALKGELIKELENVYPDAVWADVDFQNPSYQHIETALSVIRRNLSKKHKVDCLALEIGVATYLKKANPDVALNKNDFPFLEKSEIMADISLMAGEFPIIGLLPKIAKFVGKGYQDLKKLGKERSIILLQSFQHKQPFEILNDLPLLLGEDLRLHFEKTGLPSVIFLDTYEMLTGTKRPDSATVDIDEWVQTLAKNLPRTMLVITGRQKMTWTNKDKFWIDERLEQHDLKDLEKKYAVEYFLSQGIDDKEIQEKIYDASKGVPFYIELEARRFHNIKKNEGREPTPKDFGGTHKKILTQFTRGMDSNHLKAFKILSSARKWDSKIFEYLSGKFPQRFHGVEIFDLPHYSFITHHENSGICVMHELMRKHLQENVLKDDEKDKTEYYVNSHLKLFEHYDAKLKKIDIKNITDEQKAALEEAFYHGQYSKDIGDYCAWFTNRVDKFDDAAQWDLIVPLYEQIIAKLENDENNQEIAIATCLNNLALLYESMGRYEEAEKLYKQALEIDKKTIGEEDPGFATDLNNLAGVYESMGRYEEAERYYLQAIEIDKKTIGEEHPGHATRLNNLANVYISMGRYDEAERYYLQAIEIDKKTIGEEHPDYATDLNNLAGVYESMGRYEEAEKYYLQAIEIDKKTIGEEHPNYAIRLNNLANVYNLMGRYGEAEKLYKQALEIGKKTIGEEHPYYAIRLNNLALLYKSMGRYEKAEDFYKQALKIVKKVMGKEHPYYALCLSNLAGVYESMGRYEKAEEYLLQAIEIDKKTIGEEHPDYATDLNNLALLYKSMGRYEEAEELYKQALKILEKTLPANHPNIASLFESMAYLYDKMGRKKEAREYSQRAEEIRSKKR
ncbi:MAG: tetratricopeptide repeat protein [candidate division Zixibacteria bacterium]